MICLVHLDHYTLTYMPEVKLVTRNPIPNFRTQSCVTFKLCIPIINKTNYFYLYRLVLFFRNFESIVYINISHLIIECVDVSPHTDVRSEGNWTLLHKACANGHIQLVKYLVEELKCDVGK